MTKSSAFLIVLAVGIGGGAACHVSAPLAASDTSASSDAPHAAPVTLDARFDVGSRRLRMVCKGRGVPTVIVDAGMGEPPIESRTWDAVIEDVSKSTRICVYDRAGLGSSDPPSRVPRTTADMANDLNALLSASAVETPYVLVGHSLGGMNVRMYVDRFPQRVAGIVLVDSSHPEQWTKWRGALPAQTLGEPDSVATSRQFLSRQIDDPSANPERIDLSASASEVRTTRGFGAIPLIVLTHSPRWRMVPDLPEDLQAKLESISQSLQVELTRLSSVSQHRIAETAGHYIHAEDPRLVGAAILELVERRDSREAR
jgi:pimeloyl-ACP methyl ester carboxylesterase